MLVVSLLTRAEISLENCRPQVREGQAEKKGGEGESNRLGRREAAEPTGSMSRGFEREAETGLVFILSLLPPVLFLHKLASILNRGLVHVEAPL